MLFDNLAVNSASKTGRVIYHDYGADDAIFDRLGRVYRILETNSVGTPLVEYSYNGTNRLAITDYPAPDVKLDLYQGTSGTYAGLDRFGRTVDQYWRDYGGMVDVSRVKHGYDYAGNRLTRDVVTTTGDTRDQKYSYDGLLRLLDYDQGRLVAGSITNSNKQRSWDLDQLGNWDEVYSDLAQLIIEESPDHNLANELTGYETPTNYVTPVHDQAGNMTKMPQPADLTKGFTATYDAWNRLVKIVDDVTSQTVAEMEYDGLGRRIQKVVGSDTYDYYYNQQWQLLEERKNGSANPLAQYVWHPYYVDALAVRYWDADTNGDYLGTNEGAHYYLQDANFNVTAVTDDTGTVLERYAYTPYGEVTFLDLNFVEISASAIGNTHLYTGRERDPETGLQLNRWRYYASHLGRWLTRDPIGYWGGINLYRYVGAMPTYYVDPWGLAVDPEDILQEIEDAQEFANRPGNRPSNQGPSDADPEGDWDGSKKKPRQSAIDCVDNTKQKARTGRRPRRTGGVIIPRVRPRPVGAAGSGGAMIAIDMGFPIVNDLTGGGLGQFLDNTIGSGPGDMWSNIQDLTGGDAPWYWDNIFGDHPFGKPKRKY